MVGPSPLLASLSYQWNTTGCYTNTNFNNGVPRCFPHGQTTQSVTDSYVSAEDAGTITCTVAIGGSDYTSGPFTLRISGEPIYSINCMYVHMGMLKVNQQQCNYSNRNSSY